jgi:hypothetical protein
MPLPWKTPATLLAVGTALAVSGCDVLYQGRLARLEVEPGTLEPAFDPGVRSYTLVAGGADAVDITVAGELSSSTLTVDGTEVPQDGTTTVALDPDAETVIPIVVTDSDGTTGTYTLTAPPPVGTDVTLASLSLSEGVALEPAFDPAVRAYTAEAPSDVSQVRLTARPADPAATLTLDGTPLDAGTASAPIALEVGATTAVQLVVTAEDGVTTATTTLAITRAASDDASLADLVITDADGMPIALTPAFDPDTFAYTATVPYTVDTALVGPVPTEPDATVTVDGMDAGAMPVAVPLAADASVGALIEVTAPDGETTQATSLTLTREPEPCVPIPGALGTLASLDVGGDAVGIDVDGDRGVLALGTDGVAVVDVSEPAAPTLAGSLALTGTAWKVDLVGDTAYVAARDGGLHIVDIADATAPRLLGTATTAGDAYNIAVEGTTAYVAADAGGLQIVDVADPADPAILGTYTSDEPSGLVRGIALDGTTAYVGTGTALHVVDVSDPTDPVRLGREGYNPRFRGEAVDVATYGPHYVAVTFEAFEGDGFSGQGFMDVSDPTAPDNRGEGTTSGLEGRAVAMVGDRAIMAWGPRGLRLFEGATAGRGFTDFGFVNVGHDVQDIATDGAYLYLAATDGGLRVLPPQVPGPSFDPGGLSGPMLLDRGRLYLSTTDGLSILTFDDPLFPTEVVSEVRVAIPGATGGLHLDGTTLYLARGAEGLAAVDVTDPDAPSFIDQIATPGEAYDCTVIAGRIAVVDDTAVQIVTWADATTLSLGDSAPYDPWPTPDPTITTVGDTVWITDGIGGTTAFEVSGGILGSPVTVDGADSGDVLVDGTVAWVGSADGLTAWDITDPLDPRSLGAYAPASRAMPVGLSLTGPEELYAFERSELVRYDISDLSDIRPVVRYRVDDNLVGTLVTATTAFTVPWPGRDGMFSFRVRRACELAE